MRRLKVRHEFVPQLDRLMKDGILFTNGKEATEIGRALSHAGLADSVFFGRSKRKRMTAIILLSKIHPKRRKRFLKNYVITL